MAKGKWGMHWRYQAVSRVVDGTMFITLCECTFNDDGRLEGWTADPAMEPMGATLGELREDLAMMTRDVESWGVVPFESLEVGMVFKRLGGGNGDI